MPKMPMCPMMMGQMPAMPMMQMPMMQMPMQQMPMMNTMMPEMDVESVTVQDDKDEEYFASMHSDSCHKMMPFVLMIVDKTEKNGNMIYADFPSKEMVDEMTDEAYNDMVKAMPDMADDMIEERQYGGRRFARDLVGLLLVNELLKRRRIRRRRPQYGYGQGFGFGPGYGYGYNNDYDYDSDFYYND